METALTREGSCSARFCLERAGELLSLDCNSGYPLVTRTPVRELNGDTGCCVGSPKSACQLNFCVSSVCSWRASPPLPRVASVWRQIWSLTIN